MKSFYRLLTVCSALLLIVPAASANWSDNFDSYTPGTGLHGQGGWTGWENNPAWDAFVVDSMSLSPDNSLATIPTSDIVQEFTETTGEWEMTAWCYIPSGSTGDQFFIMLNTYDPPSFNWSVQLEFHSDIGQVKDNYSGTTTAIVNDQWVEVKVEIYLDANTYDIYYNGSFLASNAWQSSGVNEIAALDLFSSGGSTIFWDDCNLVDTGGALEHTTWGHIKTVLQ
ncbi:MAG: hypothetical protein KAT09_04190 [Candidatus Aegiribacteria sp.]|nr:hypothetical protein [Candidatus Aegiribacteria sp.]